MNQHAHVSAESLLAAIPTPLIILDERLSVIAANPAFHAIFSTTPAQIENRALDEIDLLDTFRAAVEAVQRENVARDLESDILFALTGRKVVVHLAPSPTSSDALPPVALTFDTTLLEVSRDDLFRDLLESAPDAMVIVNQAGKIVLVNAQAQTLFGYSDDEMVGESIELLMPHRYQRGHLHSRDDYFEHPHVRPLDSGLQLYGLHKNGREFPVEISLSPLRTEIGLLVSSTIRDITKRIHTETELRKALEKERQLNELKTHFVTMVSHEFRTPLSGIHASAELIQHYSDRMTKERADQHLAQIQEGVQQLTFMLDEILTLSKAQSVGLEFNPVPVDLDNLCQAIAASMQLNTDQHRIVLKISGELSQQVYADPKLLGQAITNLLNNAIKYSPEGGDIHFSVACSASEITITVADEGIGIPEADQKYLFELFRRGTNVQNYPGTGLGLAIVRETLRAHQGSVTLKSQLGQGSVFTLTIPLMLAPPS